MIDPELGMNTNIILGQILRGFPGRWIFLGKFPLVSLPLVISAGSGYSADVTQGLKGRGESWIAKKIHQNVGMVYRVEKELY